MLTDSSKRKKKLGILEAMREGGAPTATPFPGREEEDSDGGEEEDEMPPTRRRSRGRRKVTPY